MYKRQAEHERADGHAEHDAGEVARHDPPAILVGYRALEELSLIHISEPTRLLSISYAVFCLKKKTKAQLKMIVE